MSSILASRAAAVAAADRAGALSRDDAGVAAVVVTVPVAAAVATAAAVIVGLAVAVLVVVVVVDGLTFDLALMGAGRGSWGGDGLLPSPPLAPPPPTTPTLPVARCGKSNSERA